MGFVPRDVFDEHLGATPVHELNAGEYHVLVQYGKMRTASTFQFMLVCLLTHLQHGLGSTGGYRKNVRCVFRPDVTAEVLSLLPRDDEEVVVVKTHKINGVGLGDKRPRPAAARGAVPPSLLFLSTKEADVPAELSTFEPRPTNMTLANVQEYQEFVELGLSIVGRYRTVFPDISPGHVLLVREYLKYWEILRKCCGPQASVKEREKLHGLRVSRSREAFDNAHCEIYDLDRVEESLFNTSLWRWHYSLSGRDFLQSKNMDVRRGLCCASRANIHNGHDFAGASWHPMKHEVKYLEEHGDNRRHPVDVFQTCKHRYYATDNAPSVSCVTPDGTKPTACPDRPQRPLYSSRTVRTEEAARRASREQRRPQV